MEAIHSSKISQQNKYNEWYKNQNITTTATIPIENLKNCNNYEIKIAPGRDGRTLGTLKT
jgi:hypothetical protein